MAPNYHALVSVRRVADLRGTVQWHRVYHVLQGSDPSFADGFRDLLAVIPVPADMHPTDAQVSELSPALRAD